MLCHHHKCIFIHIPKNAGQSVEHVFLDLLDLTWETRAPLLLRPKVPGELGPPRLAHLTADEYVQYKYVAPEMFEEYFKFAFVRNPWSRMVSIYKFLRFNQSLEFNEFLATTFRERVVKNQPWFVRPQADFILTSQGDAIVDFIGRFENLQDGFNHACKQIGIPETRLPHINASKDSSDRAEKPHLELNIEGLRMLKKQLRSLIFSKTKREIPSYKRYQDYYNQESIDLVASIYRRDIETFKYDF